VYIRRLWGGTFHHIANRVLRRHGERLGYGRNYSIMDKDYTKSLLNACIADAGIDPLLDLRRGTSWARSSAFP